MQRESLMSLTVEVILRAPHHQRPRQDRDLLQHHPLILPAASDVEDKINNVNAILKQSYYLN